MISRPLFDSIYSSAPARKHQLVVPSIPEKQIEVQYTVYLHQYLLHDDKTLYLGPSSVTGKISKLCHLANHNWISTNAEVYYDIYH